MKFFAVTVAALVALQGTADARLGGEQRTLSNCEDDYKYIDDTSNIDLQQVEEQVQGSRAEAEHILEWSRAEARETLDREQKLRIFLSSREQMPIRPRIASNSPADPGGRASRSQAEQEP